MNAKKRDPSKVKATWQHIEKPEIALPEIPTKQVRPSDAENQTLNGRRKYVCLDCSKTQMVHWTERARRSKYRCSGCGSFHVEPCSAGAVLELEREAGNRHGDNATVKRPFVEATT